MARLRFLLVASILTLLAAVPASGQDLAVRASFSADTSVGRTAPLTLTFSRLPTAADGRPVVFLGDTDLTALFAPDGVTWRYTPELLPLPPGTHEVVVYLNHADQPWQEIGRFPVRVRAAGAFERAALMPSLTFTNQGQIVEGRFPDPAVLPERRIYQDFSGQLGLGAEVVRGGFMGGLKADVVGVSYQNEALRYGELQEEAPKVDLASYLLSARQGPLTWQLGHVMHGRHRHLVNSFGSRGTTLGLTVGPMFDVSVAAMNGSRIVGWRNPLGLVEPAHRLVSGTAGLEVLPMRPGALRVEASYLVGSLLPRTGFNQGAVVDAEKSQGAAARVQGSFFDQRLRFEGGLAGSRFDNPDDPALAQGDDLVPVAEERKYAHFLEATAALLQNARLGPRGAADLAVTYRRERVDPLYRTIAAYVQSDNLQNVAEVQGRLGPLAVQAVHTRAEDNLDAVPSILKTLTRRSDLRAGLSTNALLGPMQQQAAWLLPSLAYTYSHTHQFGDVLPVDGGFSPSHVPDQVSRLHDVAVDWQARKGRFGYRYSTALQDNRQQDREDADFANRMHSVSVSVRPFPALDVAADLSFDRAQSKAEERIDRTRRLGLRMVLRPVPVLTLSAAYAPTRTENDAATSLRTNASLRLEAAYVFTARTGTRMPLRGQVFLRYARQEAAMRDQTFDLDTENRGYTVNTGVSLSLF